MRSEIGFFEWSRSGQSHRALTTESDVIVASMADTITISGLGDRDLDNNLLSWDTGYINLQDAASHHVSLGNGFSYNGTTKDIGQLIEEVGSDDIANSDWNRLYTWNSSNSMYEYRDQ